MSSRMTGSAASSSRDGTFSIADIVSEIGWKPCRDGAFSRNGSRIGGDVGPYDKIWKFAAGIFVSYNQIPPSPCTPEALYIS